ncbi:hypothetical protein B0J11DRAFT_529102 [Dendryphion nanum]|uniref:Cyclase n=1 Tax=Dendryphion nanum TaxID=256645 RepID=A0A9P9DUY1_9PLEO|nr:hypothetical protein B0J11DRAFT_529102 [Dendryphion nanum]
MSSVFSTPFSSLPDKKRVWPGAPNSHAEGLGKLSILTPSIVAAAAASEIRTGRRVCLNWEMTKMETAGFNRQPCNHEIVPLVEGIIYDDIYSFNPQQSSQWDGLRHFSMPVEGTQGKEKSERVFYGGTTVGEIEDRANTRIGMQHWAKEGIAGRGVLIDYVRWAEKKGIKYSAFSNHEVKLGEILEIAEECGIEFRTGDVLFVRFGVTKEWDGVMTRDDKEAYSKNTSPEHVGVEATEVMLEWIWDTGFSAVAGDAVGFEVYPPRDLSVLLHEYLLAGWGMPIGELFDLEGLAEICQELGRWSFFITSAPFNMPGGVSSTPNCMALF